MHDQAVKLLHQVDEKQTVAVAQRRRQGQGVAGLFQLPANMPGLVVKDRLAVVTPAETVEDVPAIGAEDAGEDAADMDPGPVDDLLHPGAHLLASLDLGAPVPALGSQVPEVPVRHKARTETRSTCIFTRNVSVTSLRQTR